MAIAAAVLSALLYGLLYPPYELVGLSWVALVPLFLALRGLRPSSAAGLGALWGCLATVGVVAWLAPTLVEHFEWSGPASVGFLVILGCAAASPFYAAAFALHAAARPRVSPGARPLLLCAAWVAAEYTRTQLGFESPWSFLGDAHYASPRLRQVADLGGVFAVSAVVVLGNATLAELAALGLARMRNGAPRPGQRRGVTRATALFAAVLLAVMLYGEWRREIFSRPRGGVEVALVQGNVPIELRWRRSAAARVLRRYGRLTRDLRRGDAAGPELIVWPENAVQIPLDDPVYGPALRHMARPQSALLLGAPRSERRGDSLAHFNSAWLLQADSAPRFYDKRRLLAFSETRPLAGLAALASRGDLDAGEYEPGRSVGLFDVAGEHFGVLICMEALYPSLAREAAREGASALVNLSNDGWYHGSGGGRQHLAQVVFRAVETRLPLVRAASTGISAFVSPEGSLLGTIPEDESGVLRRALPLGTQKASVYTQIGDVFAIACVLACAAGAGWRRPASARVGGIRLPVFDPEARSGARDAEQPSPGS